MTETIAVTLQNSSEKRKSYLQIFNLRTLNFLYGAEESNYKFLKNFNSYLFFSYSLESNENRKILKFFSTIKKKIFYHIQNIKNFIFPKAFHSLFLMILLDFDFQKSLNQSWYLVQFHIFRDKYFFQKNNFYNHKIPYPLQGEKEYILKIFPNNFFRDK